MDIRVSVCLSMRGLSHIIYQKSTGTCAGTAQENCGLCPFATTVIGDVSSKTVLIFFLY